MLTYYINVYIAMATINESVKDDEISETDIMPLVLV